MEDRPISRRKRVNHVLTFEERLLDAASQARERGRKLPPGKKREMLLRSARDSEAAVRINRWVSSPGLKQPE